MSQLTTIILCSLAYLATTKLGSSCLIDPSVNSLLNTQETADVLLVFEKNTAILNQLGTRAYQSREARLQTFGNTLKIHAAITQESVLNFLSTEDNVETKSFWLSNQVLVKRADSNLIAKLAAIPGVLAINNDERIPLMAPFDFNNLTAAGPLNAEWGVNLISAPEVWKEGFTGQGIVIATIDTGVRLSHQALVDNFRSQYGWYDPYTNSSTPIDENGHGTHTTGTIAGQGGIGVAPGSKWIACRGCDTSSCSRSALLGCGDWIACPDPTCSMAPHVVSNSWGGGEGTTWFADVVRGWHQIGIIPVFAAGNSGPSCQSINSPGDYPDVISVGSINSNKEVSPFSSKGPTINNLTKPDLCAPGSSVKSSFHTTDNAYATLSGTSMACPHVAGTVALLLSKNPNLKYDQVKKVLFDGCVQDIQETGLNCGEKREKEYPNNACGWGRVSALNSIYLI